MRPFQNKKSSVKETLVGILILSISFFLVYSVLEVFKGRAEDKQAESICRGSVALREKTYTSIDPTGITNTHIASPLLCRTLDKYIPENKDAKKEQVEKEFADLMVSCWKMFGSGLIEDVFKEGDSFNKNCFVCYNVNLRETKDFKEIKATEMLQYLYTTPYAASGEDDGCKITGGYCIDSENRQDCAGKLSADPSYLLIDNKNTACQKKGKKSCCYTEYECWNRGGNCKAENPDAISYSEYTDWKCPPKTKCFIKNENYYSYGDYIQRYSGSGTVAIIDDIKPGDTYAVSFGSPTGECETCTAIGTQTGLGVGGGLALSGGYALATGTAATVCGALSGGLCLLAIGVGSAAAGAITYVATKGAAEATVNSYESLMSIRYRNTIYLGSLEKIQKGELCSIVEDNRDK